MAESVGVTFVDESDFQNEGKRYNNSQFEACSTVSSDTNGSLAGIPDFSEDIAAETCSDSGGISSHDGSKSDTDSDYNPKHSTSASFSSFNQDEQTCSYNVYFIQEIVIIKLIFIIKRLGKLI